MEGGIPQDGHSCLYSLSKKTENIFLKREGCTTCCCNHCTAAASAAAALTALIATAVLTTAIALAAAAHIGLPSPVSPTSVLTHLLLLLCSLSPAPICGVCALTCHLSSI